MQGLSAALLRYKKAFRERGLGDVGNSRTVRPSTLVWAGEFSIERS